MPEWQYCRVCDLIGQAKDAGPPSEGGSGHGWNLVLKQNPPKPEPTA